MSNKDRLNQVIASYGADPARWPADEREVLLPLLRGAAGGIHEARAIDALLGRASPIAVPSGAEDRLMARISGQASTNVVAFAPRPRRPLTWLAAIPLAASLLLGIYLGAAGMFDPFLPASITGDTAELDDDDLDLSGIGEATDYSGDQVS